MLQSLSKCSLFLLLVITTFSCVNNIAEVNEITRKFDATKDIGESVKIIYSDSGQVKLIIEAPVLERHNDPNEPIDVFSKGILISFLDDNKVARSWLKADNATRNQKLQTMIAKGNVVFYNDKNDKLQSSELIWDENLKKIYTEKFIKISRPSIGDTIYGIGFETDLNFNRIEIKHKIKARLAAGDFINSN